MSWVAVAVAAVGVGTAVYASTQTPDAPGATPTDPNLSALEREQLKLLQEQGADNKLWSPLLAEQYGYAAQYNTPTTETEGRAAHPELAQQYDDANKYAHDVGWGDDQHYFDHYAKQKALLAKIMEPVITGYQKSADKTSQDAQIRELQSAQMGTAKKANELLNTYLDSLNSDDYKAYQKAQQDLAAQQTQIGLLQGERTKRALEGNLPVSQGTIDRKASDFQLLKENLARSGNAIIGDDPSSAYSLSSPGVQALKAFNQQYGTIEAQERQGQIDTGTQGYLQAVGLSGNAAQNNVSATGQMSNPGGYASTSTSLTPSNAMVPNNTSLIQGYSSAMNPYLQQQQLSQQQGQFNTQVNAANQAGYMQLGGSLIGAGAGIYGANAKSNRRFKKNIEPIKSDRDATKALAGTPVYRWNYKEEPDGHKKHLGTMTDEAPEDVVTEDGDHLDITSYMGLLTLSTRDLHSRVLSLEGRGN